MRIGLVGYSCNSGLGELNRQLSEYINISAWLLYKHPKLKTVPLTNKRYLVTTSIAQFCDAVDVIIYCERPYYNKLPTIAKQKKKKLVCVPMQEWMPRLSVEWVQKTDLFLCPTEHCYNLYKDRIPCKLFSWPIDADRFNFKLRTRCERFLFINGNGGWKGRKGSSVVLEAKKLWKEFPLVVSSQIKTDWPNDIIFVGPFENNCDLYNIGDVLIVPHSVDGIGLELLEAAYSGIPIISTDGQPWNEIPAIAKIEATVEKKMCANLVDWYTPSAKSLVEQCKKVIGTDITNASIEINKWALTRSWSPRKLKEFYDLIKN